MFLILLAVNLWHFYQGNILSYIGAELRMEVYPQAIRGTFEEKGPCRDNQIGRILRPYAMRFSDLIKGELSKA